MVVDVGRLQIMENLRSIPKIAIAASSAEHYVMSTNSDNSRAPLPDDGSAGQQGKCQQYLHLFILQQSYIQSRCQAVCYHPNQLGGLEVRNR